MLGVKSAIPMYWKADELNAFDGREWVQGQHVDLGGDTVDADLPDEWRKGPDWTRTFRVSLRRLRTPTVVGAGTVLSVTGATEGVEPNSVPGQWVAADGQLSEGDSYTVRARVPRPTPQQLAAATVGRDDRRSGMLTMRMGYRQDALGDAPL